MFGVIADLASSILTTLFPLFAAYKALRNPAPAALAPWLTFYVVLSLLHFAESTFLYPLTYVPFYSWFRLFAHVYLLLPTLNGATHVYTTYVDPYLNRHERQIEDFISDSHAQLKQYGLSSVQAVWNWALTNILRQQAPPPPPPPPQAAYASYAQSLLSRFNAPAAHPAAGTDLSSTIFSTISAATAGFSGYSSSSANARSLPADLAQRGELIPQHVTGAADRQRYAAQARESLAALMAAYDREAAGAGGNNSAPGGFGGSGGLSKSKSEAEFDTIEREEATTVGGGGAARPAMGAKQGSGWMPWNWSVRDEAAERKKDDGGAEGVRDVQPEARSSGRDL